MELCHSSQYGRESRTWFLENRFLHLALNIALARNGEGMSHAILNPIWSELISLRYMAAWKRVYQNLAASIQAPILTNLSQKMSA
jgi:hypothetical protein